jgi:hypothetical protein
MEETHTQVISPLEVKILMLYVGLLFWPGMVVCTTSATAWEAKSREGIARDQEFQSGLV